MKRKYFLRGLGCGIIITALLLCISYRKQMTDASIIKKAKELGMDFTETTEGTASQAAITVEPTAKPTEVPTVAPTPEVTVAPTPEVTVAPTPEVTVAPTPEVTVAPTSEPTVAPTKTPAKAKKNKIKYVTIKVAAGMDSSSVAKRLETSGAIKSAKQFDAYLVKKGYADHITIGKYKIPIGADYSKIAKIITK